MSKLAAFALILFMLLPQPIMALSSNWLHDGPVDVRLISSLEGVGQTKIIPLGLEIKMEPGWHTYWRSPGVAGLPPSFDWSRSQTDNGNLAQASILYPAPERYSEQGMDTVGYRSHVIFPLDAELRQVGLPLVIDTTLSLLVCSDLCVPKTFILKLQVPKGAAVEGPETDVLNPFRALVPGHDETRAGLSITAISNNKNSLSFQINANHALRNPDLFIESDPEIPFSAPDVKISQDQLSAVLTLKPTDAKQDLANLVGTPLMLTLVDEGHALEVPSEIPAVTGSATSLPALSLRMALLLAIAGGFILNLMPCVLPVLSLKILAAVGHGGGHAKDVRRSFLTTATGILFSFLLLAVMTITLKNLGMSLGWGVQFQQPLFLMMLILVLTFFAANMWGFFEINLPRFLTSKLSDHHPKMAGDFATGALATLLATPCTAPFLGTAIGFALATGSTRDIVAIFIALGFGMTLPYIAIAALPELATSLPKPGRWMLRLRFILGIVLALTAVWLVWVLSSQILLPQVGMIAACLLGILVALASKSRGLLKTVTRMSLIGLAALTLVLVVIGAPPPATLHATADAEWQTFDEARLQSEVAAGRTVFVDITAAWCLTCKANKKFVLSDDDLRQRLFHGTIIAMQGDWTNPDPAITNFLHKFRRYGIPFDVVYGPGAPNGITLPELLSHDVVVEALERAERP